MATREAVPDSAVGDGAKTNAAPGAAPAAEAAGHTAGATGDGLDGDELGGPGVSQTHSPQQPASNKSAESSAILKLKGACATLACAGAMCVQQPLPDR